MIFVEGYVRLPPGALEQFMPAAEAQIRASRQETGCLDYAYARDLLEPNTLRIAERWQDEAALEAHFQTAHTAAFNQALASLAMEAASVHIYAGAHRRALIER
ncbi:MAG: putative quinol monooxygenase [Terricaulis sp.]